MAKKYSNDDDESQHNQRVSDFAAEPRRMLMPIQGYEKKSLVSLEEAVEPIILMVPDVKRMAYVAKMKCENPPSDNLSIDESASLILYSMDWEPQEECLYHVLNATLRSENRKKLTPWFLFLKLILTAFASLPSSHRFVYRGIKRDMSKDYRKGETIIWWGFSSCTSNMDVLNNEQFLGSTGTRTFFTIECTSGKDIRHHSYFQTEDEILLPPGRQFEVVACLNQSGGLYIIQLKETEPPFPLLEPLSKDVEQISKTISATPQSISNPMNSLTLSNENNKSKAKLNISNIQINATWRQNGITVAGGNGQGGRVNQLSNPYGVYVQDDQTIYVADFTNHRIVQWKNGATRGQVVAGENGQGNRNDQLNYPLNVIVDKATDCLIISDRGNNRVVRWPRQNGASGETIISNVDFCSGLAMDNNGYLYVSDIKKNEVRRWEIGETNGTLVAGRNEQGNGLNQPYYIFVDQDDSVYVSDHGNHRVMKWMKGAKEGIVVAGGQGQGNNLTQLSYPLGVIVDQLGTVYVADYRNHRVMRWLKGATQGDVVVGGHGQGQGANQLSFPQGLSFDRQNNLYVVDEGNARVQIFNIDRNA